MPASRAQPIGGFESAIATQKNPAAVQLDHFCCAKIGTRTVLAESSGFFCSAKHGLMDSKRPAGSALVFPKKSTKLNLTNILERQGGPGLQNHQAAA